MAYLGYSFVLLAFAAHVKGITWYKLASSQSCPPGTVSSGPCLSGTCPMGSSCYRSWYGPGQCCRSSQFVVAPTCQYGERGSCNVYYPYTCPFGTTCRSSGVYSPYSYGAGRCCNNGNFATQGCPSGPTGNMCGGIAGFACPAGSYCRYASTDPFIADQSGVCCLNTATGPGDNRPGVCPANSVVGICVVTPNNCFSDSACPLGMKCCSRGCGRECQVPLYYTIG